jgi:2-hydroxychromene-2-carboxylate isomerase
MPQVTFYFDVGSPYAYLAAERLPQLLAEPVVWQPISLGALFKLTGRSSWALAGPTRRQTGMAEIEHRARGLGLPPIHWPDPWPTNYLMAMRAATFAFAVSRGREFALRAFRDAFQLGHDLSISDHVLAAADGVGLDRSEVEAATQDPQIKQALRVTTDRAHALGVIGVPTVTIGDEPFWGEDRLDEVAAQLRSLRSGR